MCSSDPLHSLLPARNESTSPTFVLSGVCSDDVSLNVVSEKNCA